MEIVFKNRPHPNIDINAINDGTELEITRRVNGVPATIYIGLKSAIELANAIRESLAGPHPIQFETETDRLKVYQSGTDFESGVTIHSKHTRSSEETLNRASHFTEPEAEVLAKALERWAKHPNL